MMHVQNLGNASGAGGSLQSVQNLYVAGADGLLVGQCERRTDINTLMGNAMCYGV